MKNTTLSQIEEQFGTPTYIYDSSVIKRQYATLKNAFDGLDVKLHYALKALNNSNILRILHKEGAGLDAVSIEEIKLGLRAVFSPNEIMYTPNCVDFSEIQEGDKINVRVIGQRFELNDKYVSIIGELMKEKEFITNTKTRQPIKPKIVIEEE
jgi:diaminopimelate decarboxylase